MTSGWSEGSCIQALREAAERIGHSPTIAEYDECGYGPSARTIRVQFGTWNEGKRAAGLDCYSPGGHDGD